jgi:hypothetical protein
MKEFNSLLEAKKAAGIQADLSDLYAVLHEVTGALMCEDIELRALTRDFIVMYMSKMQKEHMVLK